MTAESISILVIAAVLAVAIIAANYTHRPL